MSVEAFYSLYAHYQLVSGFTNTKDEIKLFFLNFVSDENNIQLWI